MLRQSFHTSLSMLLARASLLQKQFNIHSFRIGAATVAKAAHIADVHIQTMGHLRSNTYQVYIKTPPSDMALFSKTIAQQGLQSQLLHGKIVMTPGTTYDYVSMLFQLIKLCTENTFVVFFGIVKLNYSKQTLGQLTKKVAWREIRSTYSDAHLSKANKIPQAI